MDADGLAVPLSDAIENVRAELEDAIRRGAGSDVAFEAGPVEMEFEVAFSAEGEAALRSRCGSSTSRRGAMSAAPRQTD